VDLHSPDIKDEPRRGGYLPLWGSVGQLVLASSPMGWDTCHYQDDGAAHGDRPCSAASSLGYYEDRGVQGAWYADHHSWGVWAWVHITAQLDVREWLGQTVAANECIGKDGN